MSDGRWVARASMYLPFAALEGYGDVVQDVTKRRERRREPSDDDCERLAAEVAALSRGEVVEVEYHNGERYVTERRVVRQVDCDLRVLRLDGLDVPFDSLWSAKKARG